MARRGDGWVLWSDGRLVPEDGFGLPVGDAGFVLGATVTEQLRTFRGRLFLPDEHLRRLAGSLAIVGIDPGFSPAEIEAAAAEVAARNQASLAASRPAAALPPDQGVVIFVTPGDLPAQHGGRGGPPRVVVHSFPLAFASWAAAYDGGVALRTVSVRQVPEACWPIRAKVRSRLHYVLADREAQAVEPGARAVLAHDDGRISETSTANVAVVRGGAVTSPPPADALAGVSLGHARRLAGRLGIGWREASLTAADLAAADEILLTSTPNCMLPATRLDGRPVGTGAPGPAYRAILGAWGADVGLDVAAQAREWAGRVGDAAG
ncbi:MAG: aminotransferase class IV [Planctomycetaceae bacterium]